MSGARKVIFSDGSERDEVALVRLFDSLGVPVAGDSDQQALGNSR